MSKIARITADKKLLLSNEIIEGDKVSLNADGTLYVNEIIEGDKFSINSNGIEVTEIIEDCSFDDEEFLLDFEFVEREEVIEGTSFTYYAYLSNTVILPEDCTLYIHANNERAEWIDWWWIKNDEMIRAGNNDFGTIENPYVSFNEGDSLAFDVGGLMSALEGDTLDVELRLNSEDGVPVGYLYVEIRPSEVCFLTTAMVNYYGKADNCPELMAMRTLRSHSGHKYPDVLDEYHRVSLQIIQGIEQSNQEEFYYREIRRVVENIVNWVASEEWGKAETAYLDLYYYLKERFGGV